MATKRWIVLLLAVSMITFLAGCGGSTANVQNPPPPPPSQVTIAFQPQPAPTIAVGFSENLTAVVTNDPDNLGVDWSLSCQGLAGTCGTLTVNGNTSTHTASGSPITYTAPSVITDNNSVVQIVALATADQNKNTVAPITIGSFDGSLLSGNYVLQAQGVDGNSVPYQFAGVIHVDGMGGVVPLSQGQPAGEQTVNSGGVSVGATILDTSTYFLGSDGRGTLTLNWTDANNNTGTEIFTFVLLTNSSSQNPQALISQIGLAGDTTGFSATGTMDLQQTSIAAPSGSYAFVLSGTDVAISQGNPLNLLLAFGGVFDIPPAQTAISGVTDEILGQKVKVSDEPLTGQLISGPDTFGKVTFTLAGFLDGIHSKSVSAALTGYIVDASRIQLIESDTDPASGITPLGVTGGFAIGQKAGAYGTFSNGSLSGNYVSGVIGVDLYQNNLLPSTLTSAGVFAADGSGNLTSGFTDTFLALNCLQSACSGATGAQISSSFTGNYAVDPSGTGRATLDNFNFTTALNPTYRPEFFYYLTGLSSPEPAALVLGLGDVGPSPNLHYPWIGTGAAYAQTAAIPALSGAYGFSFKQQNGSEIDGTAQMTVTAANPAVSGLADAVGQTGNGFLGAFGTATANYLPGTLYADPNAVNQGVFPLPPNPPMTVDYYSIDSGRGFWIETDLLTGPSSQVSLGYYAVRSYLTLPTLTSTPNPVSSGQSVAFTATVTQGETLAGVPAPAGTVTFFDVTTGTALCSNVPLGGGTASCTTSALATTGSNSITATYSGDANYAGSTGTLTQMVN